jgi:serine/threonine protein kinase
MNNIEFYKNQFSILANTDYADNYLATDDKFIHAESRPNTLGRMIQDIKGSSSDPQLEQAVIKIRDVLIAQPELLQDLQVVENVLTLEGRLLKIIENLPPNTGHRIYQLLDKIAVHVVESTLKDMTSETLEKQLKNPEAKNLMHFVIDTKPQREQRERKEAATIKLQSLIRGWHTRNIVVLPDQLGMILNTPLLEDYSSDKKNDLIRALCRELSEMTEHREKYKGKSIRLDKSQLKKYPYFIFEQSKPSDIVGEFDCWLEMAPDGKSINLLIVGNKLGEGTFKEVFKAPTFEISLILDEDRKRKGSPSANVLLKPKDAKGVQEGLDLLEKVLHLGNQAKFAGFPRKRSPSADPSSKPDFEMTQEWYNCDLSQMNEMGAVPLDFNKSARRVAALPDKINIFLDLAHSLELLHVEGMVHKDIKPANILVKAYEKGAMEGFLSDFDWLTPIGKGIKNAYVYWDLAAKNGLVTPYSDSYGLMLSLGETLSNNIFFGFKADFEFSPTHVDQTLIKYIKSSMLKIRKNITLDIQTLRKIDAITNNSYSSSEVLMKDIEKIRDKNCVKNLKIIHQCLILIGEVIQKNESFYNHIKQDPDILNILENGTDQDKKNLMKRLEPHYYPMSKIREKLASIASV